MMSEIKSQLKKFVNSQSADEIIATIIILNALSLFLATSSRLYAQYGWWLDQFDHYCVLFFVVELFVRIYTSGSSFFKSKWNLFDTFIVVIAILPHSGYLSALRSLRILRLVRLIRFFPKLQFLILSIRNAVPGMLSVLFFLSLFFIIFSIISFNLFRNLNGEHFSSITNTLMSMFQIMMYDSWKDIVRPLQLVAPYASSFFICYLIVMKFTLLNLFLGLIISAVQAAAREESSQAFKNLKKQKNCSDAPESRSDLTLEHKVDLLTEEIKSLRLMLNKQG